MKIKGTRGSYKEAKSIQHKKRKVTPVSSKDKWEKEFDEVWWKLMGSGEEQAIAWLKHFIRSKLTQSRLQERAEMISKIEMMKLMDMGATRTKFDSKTAYQLPYTENTKGYNQDIDDIISKLSNPKLLPTNTKI
jgi:hypothetical protein